MPSALSTDDTPLVTVRLDPLNQEVDPAALTTAVTPTGSLYVRTNFDVPDLPGDAHRIVVRGLDASVRVMSIAELAAMPQRTVVATMECAGNGRLGVRPLPDGEPWSYGAVGTSEWTGVPLSLLFADAASTAGAVEIVTTGADAGTRADADDPALVFPFARGLPLAEALRPTTLLALRLNGQPIPAAHGGPARLVVPGWYGMASVKWVDQLEATARPFDGYFQRRRYVYEDAAGRTEPVGPMRVRALITSPADGAVVSGGEHLIVEGWAWSGTAAIERVDVAVGTSDDWRPAELLSDDEPSAWTRWRLDATLPGAGRVVIRARATDAAGDTQPAVPVWNRLGYGNNAVQVVCVDVRRAPSAEA